MSYTIEDVMDAADRYEDGISEKNYRWSESFKLKGNLHELRNAINHFGVNNEFGPYQALVESVMSGKQISPSTIPGLSTGVIPSLMGKAASWLLDAAQLIFTPFLALKGKFRNRPCSSTVIIHEMKLDSNGEGCSLPLGLLPRLCDQQLIAIKHPSRDKYTFENAPSISVEVIDGQLVELSVSFLSRRGIAYQASELNSIRRVLVAGKPNRTIKISWVDQCYPKS